MMRLMPDWQDLAALSIVGLAALYLGRTLVGLFRPSRSGCASGCGKCGMARGAVALKGRGVVAAPEVVSIHPTRPAHRS